MMTFKQFIVLLEAKLDDIERGIANRHKVETGEDVDPDELHRVVTKAKEIPGVDLTKSSFSDLRNKVDPGIKQIYHDPKAGVTINHVTRKDTCVKGYGHGKTSWCVSATGKDNLFNTYRKGGRFFTIHHKDPETGEENVYGAHEHEYGAIRNAKNEDVTNEVHPDILKAMGKTPELSRINILNKNPHISPDHITQALDDEDAYVRRAAISHPNATESHITQALKDNDAYVRRAAISHPNATKSHITQALDDENRHVRRAAISHPNATESHITQTLKDNDAGVRGAAISHPNATESHIKKALVDENRYVRNEAIRAKKRL